MSVVESGSAPAHVPDVLPVLSRGRHRNARKGACFMELASYLAGERWSDHPKCTHPLLAELARLVNDYTPDAHRSPLALLIPSVIGTTTPDPRVDARIALACARASLPVVSAERQNVMAVGVLMADRVLAMLDGEQPQECDERGRRALADVPLAARYAQHYTSEVEVSPEAFRRHGAPHVVRLAVEGVAAACVPRPHEILRDMLAEATTVCISAAQPTLPTATSSAGGVDAKSWLSACQLTKSR